MTSEQPINNFAPGFKLIKEINHPNGEFDHPEWSPDGTILALGVDSSAYALWYKKTSKLEFRLQGSFAGPIRVVWSSDGQKLGIACTSNGGIEVQTLNDALIEEGKYEPAKWSAWQTKTNTFSVNDHDVIKDIKWTPKDMRLITAHESKNVIMWDTEKAEILQEFQAIPGLSFISIACSPDGKLITTNDKGMLRIRDVDNFENVITEIRGDWYVANDIDWSSDGRFIAVGTFGGDIHILETQTWKWIKILSGPKGPISSIRFSPKGDFLASAGEDNIFRLWNCANWQLQIQVPDLADGFSGHISFHPKESIIAISANGKVKLWEFQPHLIS